VNNPRYRPTSAYNYHDMNILQTNFPHETLLKTAQFWPVFGSF